MSKWALRRFDSQQDSAQGNTANTMQLSVPHVIVYARLPTVELVPFGRTKCSDGFKKRSSVFVRRTSICFYDEMSRDILVSRNRNGYGRLRQKCYTTTKTCIRA